MDLLLPYPPDAAVLEVSTCCCLRSAHLPRLLLWHGHLLLLLVVVVVLPPSLNAYAPARAIH
jgi:hypothetical protein